MANVLSDEKKQQVIALGRLGWSLRRIQGATGVRRETAAGYLKSAGIPVRPPGWERRAGSKPAIEVITDFGAGKPASGVSSDPASPEPHLPPPPGLDTTKPAIEVTTDSGVERRGLRASVDVIPPQPTPELTFELGASKPANGVTSDAELPLPPAEAPAPLGQPLAAGLMITGPDAEPAPGPVPAVPLSRSPSASAWGNPGQAPYALFLNGAKRPINPSANRKYRAWPASFRHQSKIQNRKSKMSGA